LSQAVVDAQFADVFDDQVQELEQRSPNLDLLLGSIARMVRKRRQNALDRQHLDQGLAQHQHQFAAHADSPRIVVAQRRQDTFDKSRQRAGEFLGQDSKALGLGRRSPISKLHVGRQRIPEILPAPFGNG
jgi:hypothetical protein